MNKIFYTFVLSALVLLSVQCNPKPQESDEQIGNDSIIEYAELLSITCHDDYTDVNRLRFCGNKKVPYIHRDRNTSQKYAENGGTTNKVC